jgi:hypothetical protein
VADKLPTLGAVDAGVQVNPGEVGPRRVATRQYSAGRVPSQRKRKLGDSWLGPESDPVDLISEVGDVLPGRTAVAASENGKVRWVWSRVRGGSEYRAVHQLDISWIRDTVVAACGENGIVCKEAPGFGAKSRCGNRDCRHTEEGEKEHRAARYNVAFWWLGLAVASGVPVTCLRLSFYVYRAAAA